MHRFAESQHILMGFASDCKFFFQELCGLQLFGMVSIQSDHCHVSNQITTITVLSYANHLVPEEVGDALLIFKSTCLRSDFFSYKNKALLLQSQLPVLSQPL